VTRGGRNITAPFPELDPPSAILGHGGAILDGELAAWGEDGRPDFGRLFPTPWSRSPRTLAKVKAGVPVTWVAFDVCYFDGVSFLDQPYRARRAALEDLTRADGHGGPRRPASARAWPCSERPRRTISKACRPSAWTVVTCRGAARGRGSCLENHGISSALGGIALTSS
jgi:hypothetical protein